MALSVINNRSYWKTEILGWSDAEAVDGICAESGRHSVCERVAQWSWGWSCSSSLLKCQSVCMHECFQQETFSFTGWLFLQIWPEQKAGSMLDRAAAWVKWQMEAVWSILSFVSNSLALEEITIRMSIVIATNLCYCFLSTVQISDSRLHISSPEALGSDLGQSLVAC